MTRLIVSIAFAAVVLPFTSASAQDAKVYKTAYVNMQTVFEGYYKTVQANIRFANEKREFLESLKNKQEGLKALSVKAKKLEAKLKDDIVKAEVRKDAEMKLRVLMRDGGKMQQDFLRFRQEGRRQVDQKRARAEAELIKELTAAVRVFCAKRNCDIVYDINGKSLNRMPVLLLYPRELEITEAVAKAVNEGHEDELKKAQDELKALEASLAADVNGN